MARVKLYRYPRTGTMCLQVSNGDNDCSRHSLPVVLEKNQWDGKQVTAEHPRRIETNAYLSGILSKSQLILLQLQEKQPVRHLSARELKDLIVAELFAGESEERPQTFNDAFLAFVNTHDRPRTREIYMTTYARISEYDGRILEFHMVNKKWLECFDKWLEKRSPAVNARAIHMRNIRAVFNYAIDEELTTAYPFRKYKIKREDTIHRDLTADDLRALFAYKPPTEQPNKHASQPLDYAVKYIDVAKLIFYLIGINIVDLCALTNADYYGGRIHYRRQKTGRLYDIKVEPEAAEIIRRYRGTAKLLSVCERCNYKSLMKQTNAALKRISKSIGLPPVTTYWLRHTWATLAYLEGASTDMVSDCLGHRHGSSVTATYINRGRAFGSKDELNRAIIDVVNGKQ